MSTIVDASMDKGGLSRHVAPAIFVAVMLYYMISLTPFLDLTATASIDPAADRTNTLNQVVFLALTAVLWVVAWRNGARSLVARPRGLLLLILVWFLAVSAVSVHPDQAMKRVVLAALTLINAGMFLLLPRTERQFAGLMSACCLVVLAVAYLGVALLPQLAIHQASEIREPMNVGMWRGHFPHKNAAAAAMVVIAFFGLYIRSMGSRVVGLVIVALAAVFLAQTGGKTSSAALPGILAAAWAFERWPFLRLPMVVGGVAAFNAFTIGCAISPAIREAVESLGIDPTFTNRTDIWRIAVYAVRNSPILGHGFQGFWQTDELYYSGGGDTTWAVAAFNGHNAYLDAAVTTGIPGLVLTLAWVVFVPLFDVARAKTSDNDPALTRLYVRIWLYGVFSGCVESVYFQSGNLVWFCMAFAIFGLRLQGTASAVGAWRPALRPARSVAHA